MAGLEESRRKRRKTQKEIQQEQIRAQLSEYDKDTRSNLNEVKEEHKRKESVADNYNNSNENLNDNFLKPTVNNTKKTIKHDLIPAKKVTPDDYLNQRDDGTYIIDPTELSKVSSMYRTNVQLYSILKKRLAARRISDYINIALAERMERDELLNKDDVNTIKKMINDFI